MECDNVMQALMNGDPDIIISKQMPSKSDNNSIYLVDMQQGSLPNLLADGLGKFANLGASIVCKPHGNSKNKTTGYTLKKPIVMEKVLKRTSQISVTQALEEHIASGGGRSVIAEELRPAENMLYRSNNRKSCQ